MRDAWTNATLGDVLTLEYGKALTDAARDGGEFGVYGSAGCVGSHSASLTGPGPAIVVGRKGTAGAVHWSEHPCWPIDTTYYVTARSDAVAMEFLYLLLQWVDLPGVCAQTGVPGLNRERAYEISVPLPPPKEQRRISDLIAVIDSKLSKLSAVQRSTCVATRTISREMFPWTNADTPLGDLCSIESKLVDPTLPEYADLPHVGVDRIVSGEGRLLPTATAAADGVTSGKHLFADEDVIYSKIRPELRKAALPGFRGLCSADAYPLRPGQELDQRYLYELLLSDGFAERSIAKSGRTKMPKINRQELFSIEVEVPPLKEQQRVGELLGALRTYLDAARRDLEATRSLRSAVVESLLSGTHEIPESYDQLLGAAS